MHALLCLALLSANEPAPFNGVSAQLGTARVNGAGDLLTVSTGRVERRWRWTGHGLVTVALTGVPLRPAPAHACDWDLPGALDDASAATLVSVTVRTDDDEGFSSPHLEVVSTVRYEAAKLEVQHVVWALPGAPGLRTQLRARALPGFVAKGLPAGEGKFTDCGATFPKPSARSEYLPLDFAVANERLYWGYYNDPGGRHDQGRDMLREQTVKGWPIFLREDNDWASALAVKYGDAGALVVKESPKCVNQSAHYTGAFYANPTGLSSTGWGLTPSELVAERFRECWAHWTIVYGGGDDGLQLALKQFDAARYPVVPARDLFILSNTWGPANPGGAQFTAEEFVLKELPALADLGIDVCQIDDGWQKAGGGPGARSFLPKYRRGWQDIKAACDALGLRLGLWVAIRNANLDDLKRNLDELGFISWKADFEHLASRADYEQRVAAYRTILKHAWGRTQFTLCPEYDDPRYGWYFAREYGSIYFQNLQEGAPAHLTMVPFQVLRQHWLLAKYLPANKLQVMLQNPKRTRRDLSDAYLHSHAYCFAMGVPFVPCFFQSAQFLDAAGRDELKAFIKLYKAQRQALFGSYTFPIGDEPDNASWSGFQLVSPAGGQGHLLLFRELHNGDARRNLALKFVAGQTLRLRNLETGETRTVTADAAGRVEFELKQPASYLFAEYRSDVR